jgi:hypothetical protein
MKIRLVKMRRNGMALPKWAIREAIEYNGILTIYDTRENSFNRILKIAKLVQSWGETSHMLYDPHIIWMNEGRFMLAGFERVKTEEGIADFAQSWLCTLTNERIE